MDIFKLGLRNLIGIMLPGALLILVLLYVICFAHYCLCIPFGSEPDFDSLYQYRWLIFIIYLLISYLAGMILRLNAADDLDKKSSEQFKKERNVLEMTNDDIQKAYKVLSKGEKAEINNKIDEIKKYSVFLYTREKFPYPLWELIKMKSFHPDDVFTFFEKLYKPMVAKYCTKLNNTSIDNNENGTEQEIDFGSGGKEFFNYCKMVILKIGDRLDHAVVQEVYAAEATVRFFAGMYYALRFSLYALSILLCLTTVYLLTIFFCLEDVYWLPFAAQMGPILIFLILTRIILKLIIKRFRFLRLKEVDTVYDAFYIMQKGKKDEGKKL